MCSHPLITNRSAVLFHLSEALESIHTVLTDDDADPAMWVPLAHILAHLCLAWHHRGVQPDKILAESLEEYERKSSSVPNWGGQFRVIGFTACHPVLDLQLSRSRIDRETVHRFLSAAKAELVELVHDVEAGAFDLGNVSLLESKFEKVLTNLCLAWHLRYLRSEELLSLDPTAISELGCLIPRWQWNLRLIPPEERLEDM